MILLNSCCFRSYQRHVILITISLLLLVIKSNSQTINSGNKFTIEGELTGMDSGQVILWYVDSRNERIADTTAIIKGKFQISGTVNKACEALIWTNPKNRNVDDSSVIRFILEPGIISVMKSRNLKRPLIRGSESQKEKEKFDQVKSRLFETKDSNYRKIDMLRKSIGKKEDSTALQTEIAELYNSIDSINNKIKALDVLYITNHPNSFFSCYLLSLHTRKLQQDSIKKYFSSLAQRVKNSSIGYNVLSYIYPITEDEGFRKTNPLLGKEMDERLKQIRSIHDFKLPDITGKEVNFASFKGKILVIDFWASWCGPCIANIPAWNNLLKRYNADSVRFISISLDENIDKWKESATRHGHGGTQVIESSAFKSLIALYSKVLWVPKYIIADENGKIINYDMPQPIEPEFNLLIDSLIKKKY